MDPNATITGGNGNHDHGRILELHLIQNFAPSNLNRDDTGAPKDCEFGGYRRARISSQCLKRAMRDRFKADGLLPADRLAERTKRLTDDLANRLEKRGRDREQAKAVGEALLGSVKLTVVDGKTQYLLFLGRDEIARLADLCDAHWDALVAAAPAPAATEPAAGGAGRGTGRRAAKQAGREAVTDDVRNAVKRVLDGGKAADVALFGRMLADLPEKNVDAASQVAHALSTHRVTAEFDFYTAVDDLRPEETEGADMLGTIQFNSACFYRYANVSVRQLRRNLGGDEDLVAQTVRAFLRAAIDAIPTGKQNSMAAQNPPSFVLAVVRERGAWSLANAFADPVRPDREGELISGSITRLDRYWTNLVGMYGNDDIVGAWAVALEERQQDGVEPPDNRVSNVASLIDAAVKDAIGGGSAAGGAAS